MAILDDADDLNDEAANAFLKTLEEPPPGAVLILIGTSAELQKETIVSRCSVVRFDPLPESEIAALLLEMGVVSDPADAERLAALGEGSVSRACGLADAELERFRRSLIDELAAEHGFQPPELASRLQAFIKQAGKESVDPAPARQPVDRRAGAVFPRHPLADRGAGAPLPRSGRPPGRRSVVAATRARRRAGRRRSLHRGRLLSGAARVPAADPELALA